MSEILYGFHATEAAMANPDRKIRAIYATDKVAKKLALKDVEIKDRKALDKITKDAVHQGIVIEADPLEEMFLSDLIIQCQGGGTLIMLDQVTDPHNIGAILRSCAAFGVKGMILQSRHAPDITGTLAKAACGAVEYVPIVREVNLSRALVELNDAGFTSIALAEGSQFTIGQVKVSNKNVLVLGAEGKGLRPSVSETCNTFARLPTDGPISTLNVSNAAAVALYALRD